MKPVFTTNILSPRHSHDATSKTDAEVELETESRRDVWWLPISSTPDLSFSSTSPISLLPESPSTLQQLYSFEDQSSYFPSTLPAEYIFDDYLDDMPQLLRSFSSGSHLSFVTDTEDQSIHDLDAIREESSLSPEEEAEFRATLRSMLNTAKARAQQNYESAISGHKMVPLHVWNELDETEELKHQGEQAKAKESGNKVFMPCEVLELKNVGESQASLGGNSSRASIAMIRKDVMVDPRIPEGTTDNDIAHRTKLNALRQLQLMEIIQPYCNRPLTPKELLSNISESKIIYVTRPTESRIRQELFSDQELDVEEDLEADWEEEYMSHDEAYARKDTNGEWRLKVDLDVSPEPTFQELHHVKTELGPMDKFVLPREIALLLSSTKSTSSRGPKVSLYNENKQEDGSNFEPTRTSSNDKLFDITDLAADDGIPSYENPFSSLFGKCKPVPMHEIENDDPSGRHLRERFLMHEQVRASLMRLLPEYRECGRTALEVASDLMSIIVECPEEPKRKLDVDEMIERDIDEGRKYAIALLQGFIDRCEQEGW
jgi:hypothetical protein